MRVGKERRKVAEPKMENQKLKKEKWEIEILKFQI